jgi:hypothetical protein
MSSPSGIRTAKPQYGERATMLVLEAAEGKRHTWE